MAAPATVRACLPCLWPVLPSDDAILSSATSKCFCSACTIRASSALCRHGGNCAYVYPSRPTRCPRDVRSSTSTTTGNVFPVSARTVWRGQSYVRYATPRTAGRRCDQPSICCPVSDDGGDGAGASTTARRAGDAIWVWAAAGAIESSRTRARTGATRILDTIWKSDLDGGMMNSHGLSKICIHVYGSMAVHQLIPK